MCYEARDLELRQLMIVADSLEHMGFLSSLSRSRDAQISLV